MDSISQMALGAAVGVAVMGRSVSPWRAATWGAVCGTLPDLDVLIDHGDAVRSMTLHRAETHALFFLSVASPVIAAGIAGLHRQRELFARWWLAVWLALVTHPLLDTMTVYGTQLGRPFSDHPYGVGSVFIIDPLYTLPLLLGLGRTLFGARFRPGWNHAGLVLSSAYLIWGVVVQQQVRGEARIALREQGIAPEHLLVSPTPFNSLLWRIVAIQGEHYHEAYRSLLDPAGSALIFDRFARGQHLREALRGHDPVDRLATFSKGFYALQAVQGGVRISDLRMGQAPVYFFAFEVARITDAGLQPTPPRAIGGRAPAGMLQHWLWPRIRGRTLESGSQWLRRAHPVLFE